MTEEDRPRSNQEAGNGELFQLDPESSCSIWLQLKRRFIHLIASGHYMPNDRLPAVRGLAAEIGVNYNTVSKVYRSLEEDGYIESKPRQGAYVLGVSERSDVDEGVGAEIVTVEYINRCLGMGMSLEDVERQFRAGIAKKRAKLTKGRRGADGSSSIIEFPG